MVQTRFFLCLRARRQEIQREFEAKRAVQARRIDRFLREEEKPEESLDGCSPCGLMDPI
jgi:hypothetical protein